MQVKKVHLLLKKAKRAHKAPPNVENKDMETRFYLMETRLLLQYR